MASNLGLRIRHLLLHFFWTPIIPRTAAARGVQIRGDVVRRSCLSRTSVGEAAVSVTDSSVSAEDVGVGEGSDLADTADSVSVAVGSSFCVLGSVGLAEGSAVGNGVGDRLGEGYGEGVVLGTEVAVGGADVGGGVGGMLVGAAVACVVAGSSEEYCVPPNSIQKLSASSSLEASQVQLVP